MSIFKALPFFILLISTNVFSQIDFQIATADIYDGTLSSQKDFISDMNGDHLDDIVIIINSGLVIYYQTPSGQFESKQYLIEGNLDAEWTAVAGDFNGDGFNEMAIGDSGGLAILMYDPLEDSYSLTNFPEGYFVQRTTGVDLDLDGDLDIFSCNDVGINKVLENDGSGHFASNVSLLPTVDLPGNYSNLWCDYDNDGDQDLQISKCYIASADVDDPERINLFYRNNGDGTFTEVGESINMNDNAQSWVTNMEDFDNDGDFDAFIANHDLRNRFMINDGTGVFTDTIESTGLDSNDQGAFESFAYDFDNNGFVDIITDSKKRIWLNNGDLTFTPVVTPMFMWFNSAVGDLNNDGFLDFMVGPNIWFNQGNENNWIKINTEGVASNRNGVGARVEIFGEWGKQTREVRAGQSFSTNSTMAIHFGIGEATSIDSLVVTWPSGLRSTKINPTPNQSHLVLEYECIQENISLFPDEQISICEGEVLELMVPDAYENIIWSDGTENTNIEINSSGIFYATMLDPSTGCSLQSNSVEVNVFQEIPPTIFPSGQLEICSGDTLYLTATVQSDDFMWNGGETSVELPVSESGQYFVEATSLCTGGSLNSEIVEISVFETPVPLVTDISIQSGENITLTAEGESILWFSSEVGGNVIEVGPEFTTPFLTMDVTYYVANVVETSSGNFCTSERVPVTVSITSVDELFLELGVQVYPNPADSFIEINIESVEEINQITLINNLGQEIIQLKNIDQANKFDLIDIPSGNYYLKFDTSRGSIAKSIVVKK